ncbi:hypothetical protein F5Y01DRAFT_313242 [Xylaria sp. FL0043]|nr:hypothetical protein F5Y01DRAFT_313242 [Xylaria sp. FL0043]
MPCSGHCVSLSGVYAVQAGESARDCATDDNSGGGGRGGLFGQPRDYAHSKHGVVEASSSGPSGPSGPSGNWTKGEATVKVTYKRNEEDERRQAGPRLWRGTRQEASIERVAPNSLNVLQWAL